MQIDWKAVSCSSGYRSLKEAMINSMTSTHRGRSKADLYKQFQWIIGRAMHYAIRQDRELHHVLNQWELERQGNWFGWYQEGRHPKLPSGKPRNIKPMKPVTYTRGMGRHSRNPIKHFQSIRDARKRAAREERRKQGKKDRWSKERKRREARYRYYRQQKSL